MLLKGTSYTIHNKYGMANEETGRRDVLQLTITDGHIVELHEDLLAQCLHQEGPMLSERTRRA